MRLSRNPACTAGNGFATASWRGRSAVGAGRTATDPCRGGYPAIFMRRVLALVLLLAALALAACGGGNDSQNAKTSSTTSAATTGATGTAKTNSGATGKAKNNASSKNKKTSTNKKTNKTKAGTRNGAGKTKSRSGTRKQRQKTSPTNTNTTPAKKAPSRSGKLPTTQDGTRRVARLVCGGYLAENLKGHKLTNLATEYAHAWPSDRRQAAYDGCLAGLKQPRIQGSDEY